MNVGTRISTIACQTMSIARDRSKDEMQRKLHSTDFYTTLSIERLVQWIRAQSIRASISCLKR